MKFIYLLIFVTLALVSGIFNGAEAFADDDGTLGIVRILDTQSVSYDKKTGAIVPDSQNTILKVKRIESDPKIPGTVKLYTPDNDRYVGLVVVFPNARVNNDAAQKFVQYLYYAKSFQLNVIEENLTVQENSLNPYISVRAHNLLAYSDNQKRFVPLRESICPMVQTEDHWWKPGKPMLVREDCL